MASDRMKSLLSFLVSKCLEGDTGALKEAIIGVEVYEREPGYDPRADGIVRVEAYRLRAKLAQFYEIAGNKGPVIFHLPKGTYALAFEFTASPPARSPSQAARPPSRVWLFGVFVAALLLGWFFLSRSREQGAERPALRQLTADSGLTTEPVLSGDGQIVVYASDRAGKGRLQLWSQPLAGGPATRILESNFDDHFPTMADTGTDVVFRSERDGGGIYRIPLQGGVPELLAAKGRRPRLSPDGKFVLYMLRDERYAPSQIFVLPGGGGESRRIASDFADAHNPVWSPDGMFVLFCGTRVSGDPKQEHDWWAVSVDGSRVIKTGAADLFRALQPTLGGMLRTRGDQLGMPQAWIGNRLYFSAATSGNDTLWWIRVNGSNGISGAPHRVTTGTSHEGRAHGRGNLVAFASGQLSVDAYEVPVNANQGRVLGPARRLTTHPAPEYQARLSNDGERLAYVSDRDGRPRVFVLELSEGTETKLGEDVQRNDHPVFAPDSRRVAFMSIRSDEDRRMRIHVAEAGKAGVQELSPDAGAPTQWSSDGRWLLFEPGALVPFVGVIDVATGRKSALLQRADAGLRSARLSPDQHWVAFQLDGDRLSRKVMVAPFRPGEVAPVSQWIDMSAESDSDFLPAWSPDGSLVYFISERDDSRSVWARRFDPGNRKPSGPAFVVFPMREARRSLLRNFRISPDRIGLEVHHDRLVLCMDDSTSNIWLAQYK